MAFAENLIYLRKKFSMTQEDLADYLGVSRQSVSKWETGEAYPETDKLIALCDKFSVTLDSLVRGDLTAEEAAGVFESEEEAAGELEVALDTCGYKRHMDVFSMRIALGVFLILLGVSLCVLLCGISAFYSNTILVLTVFSGAVVVFFVGIAVFLFVISGIRHSTFSRENGEIQNVFTKDELTAFHKKFSVWMAVLVSSILFDAVALILLTALSELFAIGEAYTELYYCTVVSVFLFLLAFIVGGLCYFGIQKAKYDMKGTDSVARTRTEQISEAVCGAIMLLATATFLLLGFLGNYWHPGWVVFPVGGILCGVVRTLLSVKKK